MVSGDLCIYVYDNSDNVCDPGPSPSPRSSLTHAHGSMVVTTMDPCLCQNRRDLRSQQQKDHVQGLPAEVGLVLVIRTEERWHCPGATWCGGVTTVDYLQWGCWWQGDWCPPRLTASTCDFDGCAQAISRQAISRAISIACTDFFSVCARRWFQIGVFRPIRVDHTDFFQVAIKTHSFIDPPQSLHVLLSRAEWGARRRWNSSILARGSKRIEDHRIDPIRITGCCFL